MSRSLTLYVPEVQKVACLYLPGIRCYFVCMFPGGGGSMTHRYINAIWDSEPVGHNYSPQYIHQLYEHSMSLCPGWWSSQSGSCNDRPRHRTVCLWSYNGCTARETKEWQGPKDWVQSFVFTGISTLSIYCSQSYYETLLKDSFLSYKVEMTHKIAVLCVVCIHCSLCKNVSG